MENIKARVINGQEYATHIEDIEIMKLQFYPENPRVYSVLNTSDQVPTQERIFEVMTKLDSVKNLKENIKQNGGLTDPIIVQDGTFTVLEGNSRLAAYRVLFLTSDESTKDKWAKIRCEVFPSSLNSTDIFTLLGQYHVTGKTNWDPYEQANYLYRWTQTSRMPVKEMADRLGIKNSEAERMIEVIKFMKQYGDTDVHHYSHYFEYMRGTQLAQYRQENDQMDTIIAAAIQGGAIKEAKDMRLLGDIAKSAVKGHNKTALKQLEAIKDGTKTIYEGYNDLEMTGALEDSYKKLCTFRSQIADANFEKQLLESQNQEKIKYELKNTIRLLKKIGKKFGIEDGKHD